MHALPGLFLFFCFQSGSPDNVSLSDSPESRSLSSGLLGTGVGGVGEGVCVGVGVGIGDWILLSGGGDC